jgi:hypothetical protein
MNEQNFHYWAAKPPPADSETITQCEGYTVVCVMSSFGIIVPYFFEDDVEITTVVIQDHFIHMI